MTQSVRALFFDVFGTLVDWRSGVAREAERLLQPYDKSTDWWAFADAWRAEYQPGMEEVRAGRIPFSKLDVLHRHNLVRILPRFTLDNLSDEVIDDLITDGRELGAQHRRACDAGERRLVERLPLDPRDQIPELHLSGCS